MRILVYSIFYFPEPIGVAKYTGELASWLACRGHEVSVITAFPNYPHWRVDPAYEGKSFHTERIEGVTVYRTPVSIDASKGVTTRQRVLLELQFAWNSLHYWLPFFFSKKYDVILAVCPPTQLGFFPWLYHVLCRVPWVFHVQDLQADAALQLGMIRSHWGQLLYQFERWLLLRASLVTTITEAMRQRIIQKGVPEENLWLFPNWADISQVRPEPRNNSFRRQFAFTDDQTVFLYSGNMGEKQGLDLIIQAADRLRGIPGIQFIMAGDGAARPRLEELAGQAQLSNLRFVPLQPVERLSEFLASGDVHLVIQKRQVADLVMPSKLTNIFAAGRPTLATAAPGTSLYDLLTSHRAGIVANPEDLESFTSAILRLHESPALRQKMGASARAYAEELLDKEKILSAFESRLKGLVGRAL